MRIFSDLWRGRSGFLRLLAMLLGVPFILSLIGNGVPRWAVFPVVGLIAFVSIWQIVCAIRYGERVMQDGALARVYGAYATMGMAVVLNGVFAIGVLLPQPEMSLKIEGQIPKVSVLGDIAVVTGEIDYRVLTELKVAVADQGVRVVRLDSAGGNVIAGRSIGLFMTREGLEAEVLARCFSACTLAFMGGVRRRLGSDGVLGFHGYRFDSSNRVQTVDWREIVEKDRAYLAARGVDGRFIDRIFATPPEALWRPDRDALVGAGVLH